MKRNFTISLMAAVCCGCICIANARAAEDCVSCHRQRNSAMYRQWQHSKHGENGVTCLDCHRAMASDKEYLVHHGVSVVKMLSIEHCSRCHPRQT